MAQTSTQLALLPSPPAVINKNPLAAIEIQRRDPSAVSGEDIVQVFNWYCKATETRNWVKHGKLTKAQVSSIRNRLAEYHTIDGVECTGLEMVRSFLRIAYKAERLHNWKAPKTDIGFLFGPNNFKDILDGKWNGASPRNNKPQSQGLGSVADRIGDLGTNNPL